MTDEPWRATPDGVVIACRLTPRGGCDAIEAVARLADGASVLTVRVREPPENGRANEALRALIATKLETPRSQVKLVGGAKSRVKLVAVNGDQEALIARLRAL